MVIESHIRDEGNQMVAHSALILLYIIAAGLWYVAVAYRDSFGLLVAVAAFMMTVVAMLNHMSMNLTDNNAPSPVIGILLIAVAIIVGLRRRRRQILNQ